MRDRHRVEVAVEDDARARLAAAQPADHDRRGRKDLVEHLHLHPDLRESPGERRATSAVSPVGLATSTSSSVRSRRRSASTCSITLPASARRGSRCAPSGGPGAPAARARSGRRRAHARERAAAQHARGAARRVLAAVAGAIRVRRIRGADPLPDVPGHVEHAVGARAVRGARRPATSTRASTPPPKRAPWSRAPARRRPTGRARPSVPRAAFSHSASVGSRAPAQAAVGARVEPVDVASPDARRAPSGTSPPAQCGGASDDRSRARTRGTARS